MRIKLLESEAEYRLSLDIRNQLVDYAPVLYEEMKERDRVRHPAREMTRWVGYDDDAIVARLVLDEEESSVAPTYHLSFAVKRGPSAAEYVRDGLTFLLNEVQARGGMLVATECRDDTHEIAETLMGLGFQLKQTNPMSAIELSDQCEEPKMIEGVTFKNLDSLHKDKGEDAYQRYWRLFMHVLHDVPMPVPFTEIPYEEFRATLNDAYMDKSSLHVALVDGDIVGVSEFAQNRMDRSQGITYLTGVHREFRRLGIARSLKLRALADARSRGIQRLWTDNEEGNPMYQLNLNLGFQKRFNWLFFAQDFRKP